MQHVLAYGLPCAIAFWLGGSFTVAVTIIDDTGGITPEGVLQALGWPISFIFWLFW